MRIVSVIRSEQKLLSALLQRNGIRSQKLEKMVIVEEIVGRIVT
ncbi:hypothetical protein [Okeania sp. SIO2C2]|nr:hypothetical protein [Okeania sp. SIO2C2]